MSQQENPQDSQENSSAPQADSWATPPASNRPADGASRVASLPSAEPTWSAGGGATDFLGLEQDAALGGALSGQASDASGTPEANPTQAWLFHMENAARAAVDPQAADAARQAGTGPEWGAESALADEALPAFGAEVPADDGVLAAEDALQSDTLRERSGDRQYAGVGSTGRRKQWLVAASLVATLLAAGGWQVWSSKSKTRVTSTSDPLVWSNTNKKPPKGKPATATESPTSKLPGVAQVPPAGQPPESTPTATPTVAPTTAPEVAASNPPLVAPPEAQSTASLTPPAPDQALAPLDPQPGVQPPADFTPVAFSGASSIEQASALMTPKGTRRPEASEVAGLWTSHSIPFDAIDADSVLRTPSVGAVRVLLKNGEHLQGRLHSVGLGRVCVDIALGRMTVDYSDVNEVLQIMDADLTKLPSNGLPYETAGLLYVSAKVPGGYLTGWLVQRTEGKLTLITEQAKKITIEDAGFEPISKGRARVVGRLERSTTEAGSPAPQPDNAVPKPPSGTPAPKDPVKPG